MLLKTLREEVCRANRALPREGLVTWTSGNVSGRDPESGYVVIKPSGLLFDDLTPENMVIIDANARVIEGHAPSSDTASHLFVYAQRPDVMGIVHTHSRYATAFAAVGRPIPCVLTAMADEFGGAIPCAPYARIGGRDVGRAIVEHIGDSLAILLANHGVFTIGRSVTQALKAAVMVEDVAHTVWAALQIGTPTPLTEMEIRANHERYTTRYGTDRASIDEETA
jgi:L-ribulose-5-phosphate 4-epimerase